MINKKFYNLTIFIVLLFSQIGCEQENPFEDTVIVIDTTIVERDTSIVHIDTTIISIDTTIIYEWESQLDKIKYPNSKIWYHGANTIEKAIEKSKKFAGIELDVNFDRNSNNLYVCHNIEDTIIGLTIEEWFDALPEPSSNYFWIDFKNLHIDYVHLACEKILYIINKYNLKNRIWIEFYNIPELEVVKQHGIYTILTVENSDFQSYNLFIWQYFLLGKISQLKPEAIGCDHTMFNNLTNFFSDYHIFLWHSTLIYTDEYASRTRTMCQHPAVKVVLVDYEEPISY